MWIKRQLVVKYDLFKLCQITLKGRVLGLNVLFSFKMT